MNRPAPMLKAMQALRSFPVRVLLLVLALALTVALTNVSMGRAGLLPGGDDEGSGFGGTGRSGDFDGSGFGGTGAQLPFLGATDAMIEQDNGAAAREELNRIREELQPIALPDHLRVSLEGLVAREAARLALASRAQRSHQDTAVAVVKDEGAVNIQRLLNQEPAPAAEQSQPFDLASLQLPQIQTDIAPFELPSRATVLAANDEVEDQKQVPESAERQRLPERIQRPELPPFQRIRPAVERVTISPPRPLPLRI